LIDVNESLGRFRMISLSNTQQNLDAFNEIKEIMKAMEKTDSDECERLARIHVKNAWIRFNTNMNLMKNLDFM
jgi:DNA-binding GntR family transcriptional regulator